MQEVQQVIRDLLGFFVWLKQRGRDIWLSRQHHTSNLGRVNLDTFATNALADFTHRNVATRIFTGRARHINIVHAFIGSRCAQVHFNDDVLGSFDVNGRVAHRAGRNNFAIFGNGCSLDDGVVNARQHTLAHVFGVVGQVLVNVERLAFVDLLAQDRVGVVREAQVNNTGFGHGAVSRRPHGGTGKQVDLEFFFLATLGQRHRELFGFTKQGEATHAQCHAVVNPGCSFLCGNYFIQKCWMTNMFAQILCHALTSNVAFVLSFNLPQRLVSNRHISLIVWGNP